MAQYLGECFKNKEGFPEIYKAYYAIVAGMPLYQSAICKQSYAMKETAWQFELLDSQRTTIQSPGFSESGINQPKDLDMITKYEVLTVVQKKNANVNTTTEAVWYPQDA